MKKSHLLDFLFLIKIHSNEANQMNEIIFNNKYLINDSLYFLNLF
jgi:hypothetical protein